MKKLFKCHVCKGKREVPAYIEACDILDKKNKRIINAYAKLTAYKPCPACG